VSISASLLSARSINAVVFDGFFKPSVVAGFKKCDWWPGGRISALLRSQICVNISCLLGVLVKKKVYFLNITSWAWLASFSTMWLTMQY
jgi:hypothetical protein